MHLFAECPTAAAVWTALGVGAFLAHEAATATSFASWFFTVLEQLQGDLRTAWAMDLWSIWSSRNNLVWNNSRDSAATIIRNAASFFEDWTAATSSSPRPAAAPQQQPAATATCQWGKPPPTFVKCNVDAAFDAHGNKVGFGLCLRNDQGDFLAAKLHCFTPLLEVYKGEALGLLLAIDWVRELHYKNVIFEMDAKVVVDDFNKSPTIVSDYGCILHYCRGGF